MALGLANAFGELGHIVGVCPCCNELFYLSEARPFLKGQRRKWTIDSLRAAEARLARDEELLDEAEDKLRERARRLGLNAANRTLKKIDPVFSGAGYKPHDVKVIFNPVTYVVFDGMAENKLKRISLIAKPPSDSVTEKLLTSVQKAVDGHKYEFRTLHVDAQGTVTSR